ncbi:DUF4192 family protein [Luteococcus sp. Sow4_B9]|uniref:DUF4192 family protein n=1 Tax=Luteococcus sp. Sow4_B9 TaxID=3438792 RepID=UPI003F99D12C
MSENHLAVTRLRLKDTPDFLALAPYLLGYEPAEQLVFMVVDDGRVVLTGALPLSALMAPEQAGKSLVAAVDRFEHPMVLLACWSGSDATADDALALAEVWIGPEQVLDSVHVGPQRWHSRTGPGAGHGGSRSELEHSPVVAQAVVAGLERSESRALRVAVVQGPAAEEAEVQEALFDAEQDELRGVDWNGWQAEARHLQLRLMTSAHQDWREEELARLGVLSSDELTRDDLCLALGRRNAQKAYAVWAGVVSCAPARWAAGPLLMLAFAAWLNGNGAILVAAIERAHALGDRSDLLACLDGINREAVPPSAWEEVRAREVFGVGMESAESGRVA